MSDAAYDPGTAALPAHLLQAFIANSRDMLALTDAAGTLLWANARFAGATGYAGRPATSLLDFTMREVIYVGTPQFVIREREAAIGLLKDLMLEWGLACWMETANDPFFTSDFEVKAAYQRRNDMKYELCMSLASGSVAVASSNFHSTTFGKAFNITVGSRPATTGTPSV